MIYFVGRAWNQRIASAWCVAGLDLVLLASLQCYCWRRSPDPICFPSCRMKDALPTLKEQFLALSPNPEQPGSFPLVEDGGSTFLSYASGRRGVMSLHSTIDLVRLISAGSDRAKSTSARSGCSTLRISPPRADLTFTFPARRSACQIPRQDPLSYFYRSFLYPLWDVKAETPSDALTLSLALLPAGSTVANSKSYSLHIPGAPADKGDGLPTGVWAVLQKAGMDRVRRSRWDLSFPRVIADNQTGVDKELAVLAEHADVTKAVLGSGTGLRELLNDSQARKHLKNFIVRPSNAVRGLTDVLTYFSSRVDLRHPHRPTCEDAAVSLAAHSHPHPHPAATGAFDDGLPSHASQHGRRSSSSYHLGS